MENKLRIIRTHVSFGEEQFTFLNSCSDHPIEDGYIFSKVFTAESELEDFLLLLQKHLSVSDAFLEETRQICSDFFSDQHSLVLLFSDERSGSNRLALTQAMVSGDRIHLELERERGLTMDMAYLFLFYPLNSGSVHTSSAHITNKPSLF